MGWKEIKNKLDSFFDVKSHGYKVNKNITRFAFFIILCLALTVLLVDGSDVFIYGGVYAENTFSGLNCSVFDQNPLCMIDQSVLLLNKPSWLALNFGWIAILLFVSSLILNHYLYNKGYFKKIKLVDE